MMFKFLKLKKLAENKISEVITVYALTFSHSIQKKKEEI